MFQGKMVANGRKKKGLSQRALGDIIGKTGQYISYLENNDNVNPSYVVISRLSEALSIPISEILGLDESSKEYKFTKESFVDYLVKKTDYSIDDIAKEIGIEKERIEEYFKNPLLEDIDLHFAIGRLLKYTENDLENRINYDRTFLQDSDNKKIIYRYSNSLEYVFDILQSRSKAENKDLDIDPELIKQAREMFNAFYPTTKRNNELLDTNEIQVLDKFRLLNEVGQKEGIKRIDELGQIEKYKRISSEDQATKEESSDIQE